MTTPVQRQALDVPSVTRTRDAHRGPVNMRASCPASGEPGPSWPRDVAEVDAGSDRSIPSLPALIDCGTSSSSWRSTRVRRSRARVTAVARVRGPMVMTPHVARFSNPLADPSRCATSRPRSSDSQPDDPAASPCTAAAGNDVITCRSTLVARRHSAPVRSGCGGVVPLEHVVVVVGGRTARGVLAVVRARIKRSSSRRDPSTDRAADACRACRSVGGASRR